MPIEVTAEDLETSHYLHCAKCVRGPAEARQRARIEVAITLIKGLYVGCTLHGRIAVIPTVTLGDIEP